MGDVDRKSSLLEVFDVELLTLLLMVAAAVVVEELFFC